MPTLLPDTSLQQFQLFIKEVYEIPNNRQYELGEMLDHIQRFTMRGLKGIRKGDTEKTKRNLIISIGWFISLLNRLQIDIAQEVWKRFPYACSYCNTTPCSCKINKPLYRKTPTIDNEKKPKNLFELQQMFKEIYPESTRSLEHAGVHLAEELGEFSEAVWAYRSNRSSRDFEEVILEAADYVSCILGVFNSLKSDLAKELSLFYPNNCHNCEKAPCICTYETVKKF